MLLPIIETKRKKLYSKQMRNEELPVEAVVKNLIIERDRYKQEAGRLKTELHNKENAISHFKKWQREVVKYNILQWINEAAKLEEPILSVEITNKIKKIIKTGSSLISMRSKELSFAQEIKDLLEQQEIKELLNEQED